MAPSAEQNEKFIVAKDILGPDIQLYSPQISPLRALISGAGVAGAILGKTLRMKGASVDIIDTNPAALQGGYAFLLLGNGVNGLKTLGLWEDVKGCCLKVEKTYYFSSDGSSLGEHTLEDTYIVSRPFFLNSIQHHKVECAWLSFTLNGTTSPTMISGEHPLQIETDLSSYDMIAGCEGTLSPTRSWMNPDASRFSVGTYELLGLLSPQHSESIRNIVGTSLHKYLSNENGLAMGVVALPSEEVIWYFQVNADNHKRPQSPSEICDLVRMLARSFDCVPASVIANQENFTAYVWHAKSVSNMETLYRDNVVLFGDAAHEFHPFSSQGVNGVIEDVIKFLELLPPSLTTCTRANICSIAKTYSDIRMQATKPLVAEGLLYSSKFKSYPSNSWMHLKAPIFMDNSQDEDSLRMAPLSTLRQRAFNFRWAVVPKGVIPLTAADPDFSCSERIVKSIKDEVNGGVFPYAPAMGLAEFRISIANHFSRHVPVIPEQVLAVNSAASGLSVVMNFLLKPGDQIMIPDPVDFLIPLTGMAAQAKCIRFLVDRSGLNMDVLEKHYVKEVKYLAICNPHNPLGFVYSADDLERLATWAANRDITIISDEVWSDTVVDKSTFYSMHSFYSKTWTVYGLSKGFALAGFRIGAVIGPSAADVNALAEHAGYTSTIEGVSCLSQMAAVAALTNGLSWNQAFANHCQRATVLVVEALNRTGIFEAVVPSSTFLVWARILIPMSSNEMARRLLDEAKVCVVPGTEKFFGPSAAGYIRISCATDIERLYESMQRISEWCKLLKTETNLSNLITSKKVMNMKNIYGWSKRFL